MTMPCLFHHSPSTPVPLTTGGCSGFVALYFGKDKQVARERRPELPFPVGRVRRSSLVQMPFCKVSSTAGRYRCAQVSLGTKDGNPLEAELLASAAYSTTYRLGINQRFTTGALLCTSPANVPGSSKIHSITLRTGSCLVLHIYFYQPHLFRCSRFYMPSPSPAAQR